MTSVYATLQAMTYPSPCYYRAWLPLTLIACVGSLPVAAQSNLALNGDPSASSVRSRYNPVGYTVDGATDRNWASMASFPQWLEIDLGQNALLTGIRLDGAVYNGPSILTPSSYELQAWNGNAWETLHSDTNFSGEIIELTFAEPITIGSRVRILAHEGQGIRFGVDEWEVLGFPHAIQLVSSTPADKGSTYTPADPVTVQLPENVTLIQPSAISLEDGAGNAVAVTASVSGDTLTLSHAGLQWDTAYRVLVPAGTLALATDGSVLNGPLETSFAVRPQQPVPADAPDRQPDLAAPLLLPFDRPVSLQQNSGVEVIDLETDTVLPVTGVLMSGDRTLEISHGGLIAGHRYLVRLAQGTVLDASGQPNPQLAAPVFAGDYMIFDAHWDSSSEGWETMSSLGIGFDVHGWSRETGLIGPEGAPGFFSTSQIIAEDFLASPQVTLDASKQYAISFIAYGSIGLSLNDERSREGATKMASINAFGDQYSSFEFPHVSRLLDPAASGPQYLIFNIEGTDGKYADAWIDGLQLREVVPPALLVEGPLAGSSYSETSVIPFVVEAFGFSADLQKIEIFDGDTRIVTLTEAPFSYDWDYFLPGERTISIVATDALGARTTKSFPLTITFEDGTLGPYLHYTFDGGAEDWTGIGSFSGDPLEPGNVAFRASASAASGDEPASTALTSPLIYLFAGETYELSFEIWSESSSDVVMGLALTTSPDEPDPSDALQTWTLPKQAGSVITTSFTVPADGGYYLSLFQPGTVVSWPKIYLDDVRLTGNFNSAPSVSMTSPTSGLVTVAGANVSLAAAATDTDGSVTRIDFRRGLSILGTDMNEPWSFLWQDVPAGNHPLNALATDGNGGQAVSETVNIVVRDNPLSIATHVGSSLSAAESVRALRFQSDGTLLMAAIGDPATLTAVFPSVTPLYLNGTDAASTGYVARLSTDGQELLSITVVADEIWDMDTDGADNIYVAASAQGLIKLNATADSILAHHTVATGRFMNRVDAADSGLAAGLSASARDDGAPSAGMILVMAADGSSLGEMGGSGQYSLDVAVDEENHTVWVVGFKNVGGMATETEPYPVDIPVLYGRSLGTDPEHPALAFGDRRVRAWDWENRTTSGTSDPDPVLDARWLNLYDNNMADTRGSRLLLGHDGFLYVTLEFDGGNTPLRYSPLDLSRSAHLVGGDMHHQMSNTTTVPKLALVKIEPVTGEEIITQLYTNRISSGLDNTVDSTRGEIGMDSAGRVHLVGGSAAGLAKGIDFLPGSYTGGAYHLVYSPDFTTREFIGRLGASGYNYAVAVAPDGRVATGGSTGSHAFTTNAWMPPSGDENDAFFAVADLRPLYSFQVGSHPRLAFQADDIQGLRERIGRAPYSNLHQALVDYLADTSLHETIDVAYDHAIRAQVNGFLYVLTGDEAYAQEARNLVELALENTTYGWANPSAKGLASYWIGSKVAYAYDWCVNSDAWDQAFSYRVSKALRDMGRMIVEKGGTEQNTDPASNWQGARGASGGICLLATDHSYNSALLDSAWNRTWAYLNDNLGNDASSRGWNPEGLGYMHYPFGNFVGPFGIAMAIEDPARDVRNHPALPWSYWTIYTSATTAIDALDQGGIRPDWADDNPHIRGEGTYGQAFFFLPDSLRGGARWSYDRLWGASAPHGPYWDKFRAGSIWGYLFYPEDVPVFDPMDSYNWHEASLDNGAQGIGLMTFRSDYSYEPDGDLLVQFNVRTRAPGGHNGPDGLGLRVLGMGSAWVVGGGRDDPGRTIGQSTLYPDFPSSSTVTNGNTGSFVGTPVVQPDGSGHAIGFMATNNMGVNNHKRWMTTRFDSAQTGAAAAILIGDTSDNGDYWHLPVHYQNTITISGNTFLVTSPTGDSMKGTILYPAGATITSGTQERGSLYGTDDQGDPLLTNRYVSVQSAGGDFLVALTIQPAGAGHPAVSLASGTVADASVLIGSASLTHQSETVLYDGASYVAPAATITFDAGSNGSITAGQAVQTVAYGANATAPEVAANSGWVFLGWDKPFEPVVRSTTVSARYAALEAVPTAPANLHAANVGPFSLDLSWEDRSYGETGFVVERSRAGTSIWATTATADAEVTTASDSGLLPETTYLYRVKATGTGGDSDWSLTMEVTTAKDNVAPVFVSAAEALAHQGLPLDYEVSVSDPDNAFFSISLDGAPEWLSLDDYGTGTAYVRGTPPAGVLSPVMFSLVADDGINAPVSQAFTLSVNVPPVVTIANPLSNPANIPSGVGLMISADAADEDVAGLTWSWSVLDGPGMVVFDDQFASVTGVTFDADGSYTLRITASDGTLEGSATLQVAHGVFSPIQENQNLVAFGGTDHVSSSTGFEGTQFDRTRDWGDDGLSDDRVTYRILSNSTPLSPDSSGYGGTSGRFFGGFEIWNLDTTGGVAERLGLINDNTKGDSIRIGCTNGSNRRLVGLFYWKKEDFLNGGASHQVSLIGDASLSATIGNNGNHYNVRMAVRQAGQWYLSQTTFSTAGSFSITDWTSETWAAYAPAATVPGLSANGVQSAAALTFTPVTLDDVDAVGLYAESLNTGSRDDRILDVFVFSLNGVVSLPANQGPLVDAGADITYTDGVAFALAGTVSDDGTPEPAQLSVLWSALESPADVSFSDDTSLTSNGTISGGAVHTLRLLVSDGDMTTFDELAASPEPTSELDSWRRAWFGSTENSGPGADTADPDSDGHMNLLEYALGGNPLESDKELVTSQETDDRLHLTFARMRSDLVYTVEGSSDLSDWSMIAVDPGTLGESTTVQDSVAISPGNPRFLRLRLEKR